MSDQLPSTKFLTEEEERAKKAVMKYMSGEDRREQDWLNTVVCCRETTQNDRLISIIEQEFVCVDVPPNIVQMMPSATRFATQLCSISVPPRHGKMVGYINIWMAKPIDRVHLPCYESLARSGSDEIYDRDVLGEGR